jgi:hypothetical protein
MKQDVLGRWRTLKPGQYGGQWDRVEHFHPGCYDELGQPYGETELLLPDYRRSGKRCRTPSLSCGVCPRTRKRPRPRRASPSRS